MEKRSFEELINELNKIVTDLESGQLSLEESVEKYKKGMELSLECKKRLDEAKQVIVTKMSDGEEVPFKN